MHPKARRKQERGEKRQISLGGRKCKRKQGERARGSDLGLAAISFWIGRSCRRELDAPRIRTRLGLQLVNMFDLSQRFSSRTLIPDTCCKLGRTLCAIIAVNVRQASSA